MENIFWQTAAQKRKSNMMLTATTRTRTASSQTMFRTAFNNPSKELLAYNKTTMSSNMMTWSMANQLDKNQSINYLQGYIIEGLYLVKHILYNMAIHRLLLL